MTVTVTVPSTMSYDGTTHTYTDDSDPITGLDGGGHVERFTPAVKDIVSVANYVVTQSATVVTNTALSEKWATQLTATVDGANYSAKQYALNASNSADGIDTIFNNFDTTYLGSKTTSPTVDNQGNTLKIGAQFFNTTDNEMKVWTGLLWQATGSSVNGTAERYVYNVMVPTSVFNANYDIGFVDVFLNGVKLSLTNDFTANTGTNITLSIPANNGDVIEIIGYGSFLLSNSYTKAETDLIISSNLYTHTKRFFQLGA